MTNQFFTHEETTKFIQKLTALVNEISEMKKITDPSKFKPEYDDMSERLLDILDTAQFNIILANEQYQELSISKYINFAAYVYNTDVTVMYGKKGYNERTKMLRAKRKESLCPECQHSLITSDGMVSCTNCGYSSDIKTSHNKTTSDASKHTYKQLDAITGVKKPPTNIVRISKYISIWLTDLSYIHAWLTKIGHVQTWLKKYDSIVSDRTSTSFFKQNIERIPDNAWDCDVYKIFTDELYNLLETAKRYSKLKSSNLEAMTKEEIIDIFKIYISKYGTSIPDQNFILKHNGKEYEIGLYLNTISLLFSPPAGSVKPELEALFGKSLTMPGLMFNFSSVYEQSDNVPKRYNLTQEYIYITHETFNVPYINIPKQDKDAIVNIIIKFNAYYKQETFKRTGKECNAPLFCCSLGCIINQLPYFNVYKDALKFLPNKDRGTASHIKSEWFKFTCMNTDIITKYNTKNNIKASEVIIEEVNTEEVPDEILAEMYKDELETSHQLYNFNDNDNEYNDNDDDDDY